jgi:TonB-dependent starch-binding outer membrane protein SusC
MLIKRLFVTSVTFLLLFITTGIYAQNRVVSGTVTDSKSGAPLQGVTVSAKGTTVATQTNAAGAYSLSVPGSVNTLVFTSVSYTTQELSITGNVVDALLVSNASAMENVVVIGYGTVKKKDLTGAVSKITSKDFNQGLATTPEQLITGKVAGVSITSNGGQPGQGSTIRIREGASLNASNDPLIVIDGVPLVGGLKGDGRQNDAPGASSALMMINPNDIESFTVLKDAASASIYGSRASNGVILITTKSGKGGKPKFTFSTQFSASTPSKYLDVLNASQMKDFVNQHGGASQIALLGNDNTDWQKEIYRTAFGTNNNLSVYGSSKKLNMPYRVSVGYTNQDGILLTDNMQRGTAGIHASPKLLDNHLKLDFNVNGSFSKTRFANQGAVGNATSFDPTHPVNDPTNTLFRGYYEWMNGASWNSNANMNPVAQLLQKFDIGNTTRLFGSVQADYKFHFLPDLHFNVLYGFDTYNGHGTNNVGDSVRQEISTHGRYKKYKSVFLNTTLEEYLNYIKDVNIGTTKTNINAMAGHGYYDNKTTITNYADYNAVGSVIAGTTPTYPDDVPRFTTESYFGRLILTLNDKYILQGSIRTDGSSRFAPNHRWGVFPSGSFTWKIKQEKFLADARNLNDLNLRLSYGVTGQQDGIGLWQFRQFYTLGSAQSQYPFNNVFYMLNAPSAFLPYPTWETTEAFDGGIDFGFFKNRLTGSIDVYKKNTKDLLATVNIPAGVNFGNQLTTNIGTMENKGLEVTLNIVPIRNKTVTWDFGFTYAYNERRITKLSLGNNPSFIGYLQGAISGGTNNQVQIHSVGYEPNAFYVWKQLYDATTGKPIEGAYADLNGDGKITETDKYRYKSPYPPHIMGFNTTIRYKKMSLTTVLRSNIGNYMYNNTESNGTWKNGVLDPNGYLRNAPTAILSQMFDVAQYNSDYYIQNASFLKMDNISANYSLGSIGRGINNLMLGISCQNVFTITKYRGLDPEIYSGIDNNQYPRPRIFTLSVNIDF